MVTQVKSPLEVENALADPGHPEQNMDCAIGSAAAEVSMEDADGDSVEPCVVYVQYAGRQDQFIRLPTIYLGMYCVV